MPEVTYDWPRRKDGAFVKLGDELVSVGEESDVIRTCFDGEICNGAEALVVGEGGFPVPETVAIDLILKGEEVLEVLPNAMSSDVGDAGDCGERFRTVFDGLLRPDCNIPISASSPNPVSDSSSTGNSVAFLLRGGFPAIGGDSCPIPMPLVLNTRFSDERRIDVCVWSQRVEDENVCWFGPVEALFDNNSVSTFPLYDCFEQA